MATQKFSIGEAVRFGWDTMKNNLWFFVGLLVVAGLVYFVPDIIADLIQEDAPIPALLITLGSVALDMIIQMGLVLIAIKFCDSEKAKLGDLFSCYRLFFKYLFGTILYALIMLAGMILLIVPGIIWAIKFQFYAYFIVDKGLGPIESLKRSSAITAGAKWNLFLFGLLLLLINIAGVLICGIGLFATIPTSMVAVASVYRKLLGQIEPAEIPEGV